jgi:hypothetical protein
MTPERNFLILAGLLIAPAAPADAQIRASERGRVEQVVDGTTIAVDYGRPQARGRDLFGGVVHWGETWTPGANWATTFEFDRDVSLNGRPVPAGIFSVWLVTEEGTDDWTLHMLANPRLFHAPYPDVSEPFASIPVTRRDAPHTEVLTFAFPEVRRDGAVLDLRWGANSIPIDIAVEPSIPLGGLTAEELAPYLGTYSLRVQDQEWSPPRDVVLSARDGKLLGTLTAPDGVEYTMEFVATGTPHKFLVAFHRDGVIADIETTTPVLFQMDGGRAVGYRVGAVNASDDQLWMSAERKE